jgi:Skp family chaperone for outer membrane proteins
MICLTCKKQIPDDSDRCPNCGAEVFHKNQLAKEIGFRRYQRWFFYGLFFLAFVGAIGIILKIYSINSSLLVAMADTQSVLSQKQSDLAKAQSDLAALQRTRDDLVGQNKTISDNLNEQIAAAQKAVSDLTAAQNQADQSKARYDSVMQNVFNAAAAITNADLVKIPFADVAYQGTDRDSDGLPDELEAALGTTASSTDSDGDSYADRAELVAGYDPLVKGAKLPIDQNFANAQKGKLFLQTGGYLWYVGSDAKRYYIGKAE